MKFKKNKNVNTIEYFAQCVCPYGMASCSCLGCPCECHGTHTFQDAHESPRDANIYRDYASNAYSEELAYR